MQVPLGLADDGTVRFASRELGTILAGGRGIHERVREALQTYVAEELFPTKIAALAELMRTTKVDDVGRRRDLVPRNLRMFDRDRQQRQTVAFVQDLVR